LSLDEKLAQALDFMNIVLMKKEVSVFQDHGCYESIIFELYQTIIIIIIIKGW
jgi:hypothetical protein